jgi:NhaP-type Na+/H+ or K+/H+ antiporter
LVWVLFADASRMRIADLRADRGPYLRLLALGLPLTIGLSAGAAALLLGVDPWYALKVGAAQALNVESGLNDGIATRSPSLPSPPRRVWNTKVRAMR